MANACCQAMQIMYAVDCIRKNIEPDPYMFTLEPEKMYRKYYEKYSPMLKGDKSHAIFPNDTHKFVKMVLNLKNEGIEFKTGDYYIIGDICTIPKDDFETICEQLADGVPLLAVFVPGVSFGHLEYCRMYYPAEEADAVQCNTKPKPHKDHASHMVVLLGPACRDAHCGFFFINSYGELWCPRIVLEDIPGVMRGGIGKIADKTFTWNVVKFCQLAESGGERTLQDEEDESTMYHVSNYNRLLMRSPCTNE